MPHLFTGKVNLTIMTLFRKGCRMDGTTVVVSLLVVLVVGWLFIKGRTGPTMTADELAMRLEQGADICILDVRSMDEYREGHVPGALHIGHTEIGKRLEEIRPYQDRDVVVYCAHGLRAAVAIRALNAAGFTRVVHLQGDMSAWRAARRPMESGPVA
jgi:phage shock protein E